MSGPCSKTRVPEELVDQFFDRELDEGSREKFFGMLRADLSQCAEVAKTQRMIGMLREPVEAPDLTDRIMASVGRKRGFLSERLRRFVTAGRLAAAACLLLALLTVAMVQRFAPEMLRFTPVAQPLSDVIESSKSDAASVQQLAVAVVAVPEARPKGPGRIAVLSPGGVSVWTLPSSRGQSVALPLGAGSQARFVVLADGCIDRETSASTALSDGHAPACPETLEQFITKMVESVRGERGGGGGGGGGGASGVSAPARGSDR